MCYHKVSERGKEQRRYEMYWTRRSTVLKNTKLPRTRTYSTNQDGPLTLFSYSSLVLKKIRRFQVSIIFKAVNQFSILLCDPFPSRIWYRKNNLGSSKQWVSTGTSMGDSAHHLAPSYTIDPRSFMRIYWPSISHASDQGEGKVLIPCPDSGEPESNTPCPVGETRCHKLLLSFQYRPETGDRE